MRAQSEHRFRRGQRGTFCLRKRIPLHLRDACPRGKAEILVRLRTSDDKRRAFTQAELDTISGSPIYTSSCARGGRAAMRRTGSPA